MNEEKKQLQCEIVKDLLPLYQDQVVSDVTKDAVKEHLDNCTECKKEYEQICKEIPMQRDETASTKSKFIFWKKKLAKGQRKEKLLVAFVAAVIAVALVYFALNVDVVPVDKSDLKWGRLYVKEYENGQRLLYFEVFNENEYHRQNHTRIHKRMENGTIYLNVKGYCTVYDWIRHKKADEDLCDMVIDLNEDFPEQEWTEIVYNGEKVWTKEKNDKAIMPQYVLDTLDGMAGVIDVDSWGQSSGKTVEDICFSIDYADGKSLTWNYEGELLHEAYQENAKEKYFNGEIKSIEKDYIVIRPERISEKALGDDLIYVNMLRLDEKIIDELSEGNIVRVKYHEVMNLDERIIDDATELTFVK